MYLELADDNPYGMMAAFSPATAKAQYAEVQAAASEAAAQGASPATTNAMLRRAYARIFNQPQVAKGLQVAKTKAIDPADAYLYIPAHFMGGGEGVYAREDSFDMLPDFQWEQLMDVLEPYQQQNMSLFGLGKKGRERRRLRREARWAEKRERIVIRGESGGGALGKIGDALAGIFGGGGQEMPPVQELPVAQPKTAGFMGMPNWVLPVVAVGGIVTVLAMTGRKKGK